MKNSNAYTLIKNARDTAVKNRQLAIVQATKVFDNEISAYDMALRQLSGGIAPAPKAAPAKKLPRLKKHYLQKNRSQNQ